MSLRFLPLLSRKLETLSFTVNTLRSTAQSACKNEVLKEPVKVAVKNPSDDMPILDIQNPFEKAKPKCMLCKYEIIPDYKNVRLLSQFVSPYTGRIYGRHITGLCKAKQESVEKEIIKSQNCGLMPYYFKKPSYLKDPKLFDVENPLRPHRF